MYECLAAAVLGLVAVNRGFVLDSLGLVTEAPVVTVVSKRSEWQPVLSLSVVWEPSTATIH